MRFIAREAGVGIATLTRHFPSKEELVVAVIRDAVGDIEDVTEEHREAMERDPHGEWRAAVFAVADLELAAMAQGIIALYHLDSLPEGFPHEEFEGHVEDYLELNRRVRFAYDKILDPAREAGLVAKDLDTIRFHLGLGATSRRLPDVANLYLTDSRDWLINTFLDGLARQAE